MIPSIPLLTAVLVVGLVAQTALYLKDDRRGPVTPLQTGPIIVTSLAFANLLHTWNLLGYRL